MDLSAALQIQPDDNIAIVGGGGKSSAMFRLGRELAQAGRRVLLTTTTRIFVAQIEEAPAHVTFDPQSQSLSSVLLQLETALSQHKQVLLIGAADPVSGKAFGLEPNIIDAIAQMNLVDIIINEADGSRMRPFKAPAAHEPVIPASTTLVVPTVGLDALGKPLNDAHVHRAALVAQLGGTPLETLITPQTVAAVLTHPSGGLKNVPPSARVIALLNKLDTADEKTAHSLARMLLKTERIDSVMVGNLGVREWGSGGVEENASSNTPLSPTPPYTPSPIAWVENRVAAIVLAAGGSSRFGSFKQMSLWQGKPLFLHAVDAALASEAEPVIVVLGANAEACLAALGDRPVQIVVNPRWAEGQSASMQAGLDALPDNINAAIFPLADQPLVTGDVIDALLARYRRTLAPVVWPEFEGQRGNPVLFDRRLFPEMRQVVGDTGARPILLAHQTEAERVPVSDAGVLKDVDTPEDLKSVAAN